jgi:type II secretory pathway pseudopilin PulG
MGRERLNERGIASILFAMIMMIVITLIVLALAQVSRRGQQETLDTQLSTQAYYAAESGVNDVLSAMPTLIQDGKPLDNPDCPLNQDYKNALGGATYSSTIAPGVSYICAKVDPNPKNLVFSSISTSQSTVSMIETNALTGSLTFQWGATDGTRDNAASNGGCPTADVVSKSGSNPALPQFNAWNGCQFGLLRFDIVHLTSPASLTRGKLFNNTTAVYAVPTKDATGLPTANINSPNSAPKAVMVPAACNSGTCQISLNVGGYNEFAIRMQAMYAGISGLTIGATPLSANGNPITFHDSQASIDVTGKAQNVLRRIKVFVPIGLSDSNTPGYALSSGGTLCKQFMIGANLFNNVGTCPNP